MVKSKSFALEQLEDRAVPSGNSVQLDAGVLSIVADAHRSHTAVVSQPDANTVQVQLDGKSYTFTDPVTTVNYTGGERSDKFTNLTPFSGNVDVGGGNNVVLSKAASVNITAGDGNNVIQESGSGSTIEVGNGNNNIYGGAGNTTIKAGDGRNLIYDLLGTNQISIAADANRDYVFTNAASTVEGAEANDRVARFFDANRLPGSGAIVLDQGVLYFAANNNGDTYILNQVGNKVVAVYNLNDGNGFQTQTFNRSDVKLVANFGGAGNDTIINNTDIPDVQYGAGGNNTLIGGTGALDLEKAGGASGASTAIGRSPVYNDLNGSGNTNIQSTLIANPRAEHNIFRTNNPADVLVGFDGFNDLLVSPFGLKRGGQK
ncbi:MAG: hypothetical protein HY040_22245 [Planctomycetes bacterium]|nr:hypothetical protein [Planctomycetota bacterium]